MPKKKIERGYATSSIAKKIQPPSKEVIETKPDNIVDVPDTATETDHTNDVDHTKDNDRLLKWQIDYEFKSQDQKRMKLESSDTLPEFQVPPNESDILEILRTAREEVNMVPSDELNKTFLMMEKMGFDRSLIKACLKNTCGDLNSAIAWAYLNYPISDLPVWFSRDNAKANVVNVNESDNNSIMELNDYKMHDNRMEEPIKETIVSIAGNEKVMPKETIDMDMKQRILASLDWMDSEEEDIKEKSNVVDDYASLYIKYLECKNTVSVAKAKGDKLQKKSASNSANKIMQKIIQLKCQMDLDQLKSAEEIIDNWASTHEDQVVDKKSNVPKDSQNDDELGLDMLEESAVNDNNPTSTKIFIQDLSWKGWSGSSPTFWLNDFVRRNYPNGKISVSLVSQNSAYSAKLSLKMSDEESREYGMEQNELVKTKNEAKDYIALKALFILAPEAQIRTQISPPFRDLWEKWSNAAAKVVDEEVKALDEDRVSFIQNLIINHEAKATLKYSTVLEENGNSSTRNTYSKSISNAQPKSRANNSMFQKYLSGRSSLPIYSSRQIIIDQIRENQVVIISGETGSGKSTQIPQFIMEDAIERSDKSFLQLYCCEPRRISAISLATRVSVECGDGVNQIGKLGSWIGYKVRMDNRTSSSTLVTFCTLGILLRLLVGDPNLSNISHVVVDEVHERSVESDFLLLLLKRLISVRHDLKLILMSATADIQKYKTYFRSATEPVCLNIPGKVFPVTEFYLEDIEEQIGICILLKKGWEPEILEDDYIGPKASQKISISRKGGKQQTINAEWNMDEDFDTRDSEKDISLKMKDLQIRNRKIDMEFLERLITYVVKYSLEHSLGSILVFLPGVGEINALQDRLNGLSNGRSALPCITFPLYSDLPNAEQLKVFEKVDDGFVKVVLSTNIAETGLTVPDVTFVIDTAKARELSYDPTLNLTVLREIVVSKSNCLQRRGRAGRTQAGIYYNILPKSAFDSLPNHRTPELMRLPLEGICLKARAILGNQSGSLKDIFSESLDPPPIKNIEKALSLLKQLQAMTKSEELTPLGVHLSKLGLDVKLGKMLIYAVIFRCFDPILTISACLSIGKSIFVPTFGDNTDYKRALKKFYASDSDLLMIYYAYLKWKDFKSQNPSKAAMKAYCRENYMNVSVLSSLDSAKSQILRSLFDTGIIDRNQKIIFGESTFDTNSSSHNITKTILSVAFFPNIAQAQKHTDRVGISLYRFGDSRLVNIHQNTFLCDSIQPNAWYGSNAMKVSNRKIIALDLNHISPIGMLCLVANDIEINIIQNSFTVFDGTITIKASPKALIIINYLSKAIQKAVDHSLNPSISSGLKHSAYNVIQNFSLIL